MCASASSFPGPFLSNLRLDETAWKYSDDHFNIFLTFTDNSGFACFLFRDSVVFQEEEGCKVLQEK